jgi:hypothetical protein
MIDRRRFLARLAALVPLGLGAKLAASGLALEEPLGVEMANGSGYSRQGVRQAAAIFDWADAQWSTAKFTAHGAVVYAPSGAFTVLWPTADQ